ncbi:MAG: TIGR01212 family radical SAM protein [Peptostreptococcales bacterium]
MELIKPYNSIGNYLKNKFNTKVVKLSLDGDFTCPNRDGTLSTLGCIYCSSSGSGDFTSSKELSIDEQIHDQIARLQNKWPSGKYIAYFQNHSNTYGPLQKLSLLYKQALENPNIIGIAIATRPDCLSEEILELLDEINQRTFLWVELGLQTIHEDTSALINRCYPLGTFETALMHLNAHRIHTVVHLIMGLPHETRSQMLESVNYLAHKNIFGIKMHSLHVIENTPLATMYLDEAFPLLTKEAYISILCDALELLPNHITIHRLTGDAPWKSLIAPKWSTDKRGILNGVVHELKDRQSYQGLKFKP